MTTTSHIGITLVEQAQAQKEVTVNEALVRIDALLNSGAKSRTTTTPPGSPASGDLYIVAASATGDWAGQDGKITYFDQIWRFIVPNEGMLLWVNDEDTSYVYNGSSWILQDGYIVRSRVVTASGSVSITTVDYLVIINKTSGAATAVSLPSSPAIGRIFIIKDGKGDATTQYIRGSIDDVAKPSASLTINSIEQTVWSVGFSTSESTLSRTDYVSLSQSDIDGMRLNLKTPTMGKDDYFAFEQAYVRISYRRHAIRNLKGTNEFIAAGNSVQSVGLANGGY